MKKHLSFPALLSFLFLIAACDNPQQTDNAQTASPGQATFVGNKIFDQYWYNGEAELNSYSLEQARYGELHNGEAVLVFVTEPFSKSKHVKLDSPGKSPQDKVSVMKLNLTKKFYTGIYPYSIMQSSFTPIDLETFPHTLKVTTSSQEWCGHSFTQYNLQDKGYRVQQHSYFETEGDIEKQLPKVLMEDEIWSRIRINPGNLPTGKFDIIPGSIYARLRHSGFKAEKVTASLEVSNESKDWMTYRLEYPNNQRSLSIHFSKDFPYQIQGWEENFTSGFGGGAKKLVTKATLKKSIRLDYWNKHGVADAKYRAVLGLD